MRHRRITSSEINLHRIEVGLKKLKKKQATTKELKLNKRFERLKEDNPMMWDEMYPKYIETVRQMKVS